MRNVQILLLVLILCSCAGDKESRKIRRKSKIINDSEILIQAGSDGAASYITFKLRENRFFTIEEVVMFWWDYYAGTWEISGDTFAYIISTIINEMICCILLSLILLKML